MGNKLSTVAVLRDTSTGACVLVDCRYHDELDVPRLEEFGYELTGWLEHREQYRREALDELPGCGDEDIPEDVNPLPCFTTCMAVVDRSKPDSDGSGRRCDRLIMIDNDGASYHCTEHEGLPEE